MLLIGTLLTACATASSQYSPVSLDSSPASFSNGRVMVFLIDEEGLPMARTRVDFSWESPQFHRTSALTNFHGQVSFAGVPEVAEVSIDHPGGNYTTTLMVPQRGTSELRLILETYGENRAMLQRLVTPTGR